MSTAAIAGTSGSFGIANHSTFGIRAWSADLIQEVNDTTSFNDSGYRTCIGGLKSVRGSASGYAHAHGAGDVPGWASFSQTGSAFTLTATSGCTYVGTAVVSNIRLGTGVDGNATLSYDFVSTGAITETWAIS